MKLKLHENIQFIYELALAQKELKALGVEFEPTNDLRGFVSRNSVDIGLLRHRVAYLESIDSEFCDYYYIQKYNQTGSVNQYLTHWIYPYKGKFHPQMIRSLLNIIRAEPGDTILDPFVGSGTTSVETQLLGINCIAIDISPLCVLMSKVKTESIEVLEQILEYGHSIIPSTQKLSQSALFAEICVDDIQNEKVRNFYKMAEMVAFSDESRRHKDFLKSFHLNIEKMSKSLADFKTVRDRFSLSLGKVRVEQGDARELSLPHESVDGIITSPPYSIALNYVANDAHALKALGYDLNSMKENFVGVRGTGIDKFRLYNADMSRCFKEMYRVLKPNKFCVVVIGNVTYQNEEVDTTGATIDSCKKAGFEFLERVDKIIFGLYNVMQKEYILFFRKPLGGWQSERE
jgi:DNA modification methylase